MNLLGFYLGYHDSNMCAVRAGRVQYRKFERRSGVKHERVGLRAILETCEEWSFKPEWVAYSDGDRNGLGGCAPSDLFRESHANLGFPSARRAFCVDHHFAHVLSAWPCVPDGMASMAVALDGRGDNGIRARVIRMGKGLDIESLFYSTEVTIGRFFTMTGRYLGLDGLEIDLAGKVMGAQAHGVPDLEFVARHIDSDMETLPRRLLTEIPWRGTLPLANTTPEFFRIENASFLDWLASCHLLLSRALEGFFARYCSPDQPVVYAGGCAQNTVFNRALAQRFSHLVIPPHAYDGGLSLGCVEFLRRYLDLPLQRLASFPFSQDDEWIRPPSRATVETVATLLAEGRVVGWMSGQGEIGPRALGHRSILYDPRSPRAKDVLNQRVKRREPWRPYAASVLAERASEWFEVTGPHPFMLQAIPARPNVVDRIPGVIHCDGTCRIQTVDTSEELEPFRELLTCFENLTGVPLLLNTSLNGAGEPIYGFASQARRLLASGRIDALCLGDELLLPS